MRSIYTDLINKIDSLTDGNGNKLFKFVNIWNDNYNRLLEGEDNSPQLPACYIEIENPQEIQQLGDGCQIYDPLYINIHVLHDNYNEYLNSDSYQAFNRDLAVFDLKQTLFKALTKYKLSGGGGILIRSSEMIDESFGIIHHFAQQFTTTFVDSSARESTYGVEIDATSVIQIEIQNG